MDKDGGGEMSNESNGCEYLMLRGVVRQIEKTV